MSRLIAPCALLLFASGSAWASPQRFDYLARRYPADGDLSETVTRRVGEAFARETGITPARVAFENQHEGTVDLRITYVADAAVTPVTTDPGPRTAMDTNLGSFESREACEAGRASGVAEFRDATGLEPVLGYCTYDITTDVAKWGLKIEAFGTPRLVPSTSGALIFDVPFAGSRQVLGPAVERELAARGVRVRFVKVRSEWRVGSISVSTFADRPLDVQALEGALVYGEEACEEQLAELRAFTAQDPGTLVTYCGHRIPTFTQVTAIRMDAAFEMVRSAEHFGSYEECRRSRDEIVEVQRQTSGKRVLGGLCSYYVQPDRWVVALMQER